MKTKEMIRELIHFDIVSNIYFSFHGDTENADLLEIQIGETFDDELESNPVIMIEVTK